MDLWDSVLVAIILGGLNVVFPMLLNALVHMFMNVYATSDDMHIGAIDRYLAEHGICTTRLLGYMGIPSLGWHVAVLWKGRRPVGLVFAHLYIYPAPLSRDWYDLYWIGDFSQLERIIVGDPNAVALRYVYPGTGGNMSGGTSMTVPPAVLRDWQISTVDRIVSAYKLNDLASCLISGPPGVGKSTIGELIAARIMSVGVIPQVVKNYDLTTPGLIFDRVVRSPSQAQPVVLMLDEIDATIDFAENKDKKDSSIGRSLADNPVSLLGILDRLGCMKHVIVIATSNKPLSELEADKYMRYTRTGRMNIHIQI